MVAGAVAPAVPGTAKTGALDAPCQSLHISYRDPNFGDLVTEDVFLDPRDSLPESGSLLLVSAAGVSALQQKSDREHQWAVSAQAASDHCRRDYLREQQYLLEELRKLSASAPKGIAQDIHLVMERAMRVAEEVAEDATVVMSAEDIQAVAESVGPRLADDDELIEYLVKESLDTRDELTLRLLLQRIRADTEALVIERNNARDAKAAIEGSGDATDEHGGNSRLVEAMMRAAEDDGATHVDVIDAIIGRASSADERQAIEDVVTRGLRSRYNALQARHLQIEPQVIKWRETLATEQQHAEHVAVLSEEVQEAEERLRLKEAAEAAPAPEPVVLPLWDFMDRLSAEDQAKVRSEEQAVAVGQRRAQRLREELMQCEGRVEHFEETWEACGVRCRSAEQAIASAEDKVATAEASERQAEDALAGARLEESELRSQREELEDELAASKRPPPKEADTRKLQEELELARTRNEELRVEEARLFAKEHEYELRYDRVENAWRAELEERAAAALAAELAAAEAAGQPIGACRPRPSDPLLLEYSERVALPEYSQVSRFNALHTDTRARERRLHRARQEAATEESAQLLARMELLEAGEAACSSGPRPQVPVAFRRPEDLRVRLAGAERALGQVSERLLERGLRGAELAEELRSLGRRLAASASESSGLHGEIPRRLVSSLGWSSPPTSGLRDELLRALERHEVCMSRAEEAWRRAELECEHGASEAELELEQELCVKCEEDLTGAAQGICHTAAQAARNGPKALVPHAKLCCQEWEAAEQRLVSAAVARNAMWPRALQVAAGLASERAAQNSLKTFLRAEERRRNLLDAEIAAPPEARRALSAMRMASANAEPRNSRLLE